MSTNTEPPRCIQEDFTDYSHDLSLMPTAEGAPEGDTFVEQYEAVNAEWDESDQTGPADPMYQLMCRDPNIECDTQADCIYDQPEGDLQWRLPDEPEIDVAALVADVEANLLDELPQPRVATNPGENQSSIVNVPTFVHVENWTGTYETPDACSPVAPDFCISAVAEPRMIFDPGEPGVDPVDCEGPGQPYDPDHRNDDPFAQAEWPETCTHTYTTRTGTSDRPDEWPAEVTVIWDVTWDPPETDGTEVVELTTEIPQEVTEINAVVTD